MTVPDDLRIVLEQCLAEDATTDNLSIYLPTVRQIITNLLQGLRGKQSIYRRIVSDHKHRSDQSGHDRAESRSSRSERSSRRDTSHRSHTSRTAGESERPERDSLSRRSGQTPRRRDPSDPAANGDESFVGGFSPNVTATPTARDPESNELPNPFDGHRRTPSIPPPPPPPLNESPLPPPPPPEAHFLPPSSSTDSNASQQSQPIVPASVKRFSLVDKPMAASPPSLVVEPSSPDPEQHPNGSSSPPPPDTPPIDAAPPPAMANSLAALKKSDTLERRASKRFSTYNISKMTGSATRERSVRGGQTNPTKRRSLAVSSALTPGELAVLTEVDDEEQELTPRRRGSSRSRKSASRQETPERATSTPPVPPLPSTPARTPEPVVTPVGSAVFKGAAGLSDAESPPPRPSGSKITVFLQLGREVKKATIDPGLSVASLRILFVDKFSYNPGLENFPAIYIRDPSSGVQYELEDMDEVKEKCLLSLNIERKSFCHFL